MKAGHMIHQIAAAFLARIVVPSIPAVLIYFSCLSSFPRRDSFLSFLLSLCPKLRLYF